MGEPPWMWVTLSHELRSQNEWKQKSRILSNLPPKHRLLPPSFLPWCHVLGIIPSLSYGLLGICHNRTANTLNCPNYPGLQLKWYREGEAAVYRLHHHWVQPSAQNPDCNYWERRDHKQVSEDPWEWMQLLWGHFRTREIDTKQPWPKGRFYLLLIA